MGRLASIFRSTAKAMILLLIAAGSVSAQSDQWRFPFPTSLLSTESNSDTMTLEMALHKVAQSNRNLEALKSRQTAMTGAIRQAGMWPNPELELETEEFGGSLPGFSQSEWSLSLSQEFELWGKRGARERLAETEAEVVNIEAGFAAFDIYIEAAGLFYELLHAQIGHDLIQQSSQLAEEMVEAAGMRYEKGAIHVSELHMAELEVARTQINLDEAANELANAKLALAAMWNGNPDEIKAVGQSDNEIDLPRMNFLKRMIDGSRDLAMLKSEQSLIKAELNSSKADGRPSLSFHAGIKHIKAEDINTFLFGVSMPLPLFNRNQGQQSSLQSQSTALQYEQSQTKAEMEADIAAAYENALWYTSTLDNLDAKLIPKARITFDALKDACEKGKMPYLSVLEGKRALLELQHERNDTMLSLRSQILFMESMLGIKLNQPVENYEE